MQQIYFYQQYLLKKMSFPARMHVSQLEERVILCFRQAEKYHFNESAFFFREKEDSFYVLYDERKCMASPLVAFSFHIYPSCLAMKKDKDALYIDQSIQNKGIGTEIVSIMECISIQLGLAEVEIEDARAKDFWKKAGYHFVDCGFAVKEL
jgi:hypothetical protein